MMINSNGIACDKVCAGLRYLKSYNNMSITIYLFVKKNRNNTGKDVSFLAFRVLENMLKRSLFSFC